MNQNEILSRKVIQHLYQTMAKHEWLVRYVDDGGGEPEYGGSKFMTEDEVMDTVFSVDESTICFKKGKMSCFAYIVLGNDGYDCIADNSCSGEFGGIMETEVDPFCEDLAG